MATFGISFRRIESKNQSYSVYTFNDIKNKEVPLLLDGVNENNKVESNEKAENNILFTITDTKIEKRKKNLWFYSLFILFLSLLITFGIKFIYNTTFKNFKAESDKLCLRLIEQLRCDEVIKTCFETLCIEFYEDINNKLNDTDNTKTNRQKIEEVANKYEKQGYPIPKYCCYFFNENEDVSSDSVVYKGFTKEVADKISNLGIAFVYFKHSGSNTIRTIKEKEAEEIVKNKYFSLMGNVSRINNLWDVFFRRSEWATVEDEDMLVDTDIIYDKDLNNKLSYVFCGMPKKLDKKILKNYYTLLADKHILLAMKNDNSWYFSKDFPEDEKELIQNPDNREFLEVNKGYYVGDITIDNETFTIYSISKDLYSCYCSEIKLLLFPFVFSFIIFCIGFMILENIGYSVAARLRKDMLIASIIPILTVSFIFYLFVKEMSEVKKSEIIFNLHELMDEVENKEMYFHPLLSHFLKEFPNYDEIKNYILNIAECKDDNSREELCKQLDSKLKEKITGRKFNDNYLSSDNISCTIKELIICGKDGWISSATDNEESMEFSPFAELISNVIKPIYFRKDSSPENKISETAKGAVVIDSLIEVLSSSYGSELPFKIINEPNKLIYVLTSFQMLGLNIGTFPNVDNYEFVVISLMYFDFEIRSRLCGLKNELLHYKSHLASGSIGDELYCFYAPNLGIGDQFFYSYNEGEDLKTVKELVKASSWINNGYIPVSKKVDINGIHFLEAKQGNVIKDNVYAALGSEYPIIKNAVEYLELFGEIVLFALFMILIIAQSVIIDLIAPVKRLIEGAMAAAKGNYSFRTNFKRKDELGALCDSFDKMMKGLEEKQLMNRMVSKSALKVASNLSDIDSKKVDVALLYVTVPGFDKIMKNTPPLELFSKLRKQIAIISEIVIDNGGDIDKIMGEKMLVAFRIGDKTSEEVAVKASKVASLIETCDKLLFKVSVGVNYGQVISGYLGVGEKRDFTIIGDPVNVAARIAVFGEKLDNGKCLVSETIFNYLDSDKAKLLGEVELKGKSQPMKVYQLS